MANRILEKSAKSTAEMAEDYFRNAIQGNTAVVAIGSPHVRNGTRCLSVFVKSRYTAEAEKLYRAEMETDDAFPDSGLNVMILEERRKP
jgi:hypothetical protein